MKLQLYLFLLTAGSTLAGITRQLPPCTPEYKRESPEGPEGPGCVIQPECRRLADVALVLDASQSIGDSAFNDEKLFVQKILGAFEVGPNKSRFAAVTFSDKVISEFSFNTFSTKTDVLTAVNSIDYASGMATLIYKALEYTHDHVFKKAAGDRVDVPDTVILVTDGETNPGRADRKTKEQGLAETQRQANRLKAMGVKVFTIGVGPYVNENELQKAASEPSDRHYLKVASYEELNTDEIVQKVTKLTCPDPPSPPCPRPLARVPFEERPLMDYPVVPRPPSPPNPQSLEQSHGIADKGSIPETWGSEASVTVYYVDVILKPGLTTPSDYYRMTVPSRYPSSLVCRGKPMDLLFVLDQSTSLMSEASFRKELDFVNAIVKKMDLTTSQVSVMKFSDREKTNIEIKFNQYSSKDQLTNAISRIQWGHGNTYTDSALDLMLKEGFTAANGARDKIDKIGIIVTDGGSTSPEETKMMAAKVQKAGITMFAIGVGPEFATNMRDNLEELNTIASDPDREYVFTVDDVNALPTIQRMVTEKICEDACKTKPIINCTDLAADIVFLLDKSTSLNSTENFNKELLFVSDLVDSFDISPTTTRVAAISFSTKAKTEFHLDTYGSRVQVRNAIAAIPYTRGDTNMHLAFQKMMRQEFSGQRANRKVDKRIGVVLTDGNPTNPYKLDDEVRKAKAAGIKLFAIGIGDAVNEGTLDKIASSPSEYFSFKVASLDTLFEIRQKLGLHVCEAVL